MPGMFENVTQWNIIELLLNIFGIPLIKYPIYNPLWFVRELFILFLVYPVIMACINRLKDNLLLILLAIVAVINSPFICENGYMLNTSLPFFTLGIWLGINKEKRENIIEIIKKKNIIVISLFIAIILSFAYNIYDMSGIISSVVKTSAIILFFPIIFYIAKYVEKRDDNLTEFFLYISKYSFMIYVLHGKMLSIAQIVCVKIFGQNDIILAVEFIFLPALIIAVVTGIAAILNKMLPKVYRFLIGGR